ncbi:MAG: DUF4339 domain-containing protein [Verrucomicrobiota bacterium]
MFTIIGGDGKEYGPATVDQLRGWIASGRANLDTQAKIAGSTEWHRLGDFPEFASGGATSVPGATPPTTFTAPVPAAAPVAMGPIDPKTFAADLIARSGKLDVFSCLDRAFKLWTGNFLPLVGVTLLIFIIGFVLSLVPFFGSLAQLILTGVFYGGLYYYYLGRMRGQPRSVGDAFAGFSRFPGALILAGVLTSLIPVIIGFVFAGSWFFSIFAELAAAKAAGTVPNIVPPTGGTLFAFMAAAVLILYISVAFIFTIPLVIDRGLGAWQAMMVSMRVVSHQWFRVFFLLLLAFILTMLGMIAFIIGVLFTFPIMIGSVLYAYEDLCNPKAATPALTT